MKTKRLGRRLVNSIKVIFILCVVLLTNAFSGIGERQQLGIAPGSYDLSTLEDISQFAGSLNFRIPVSSVAGRGEFGYDLTVGTQNLWYVTPAEFPPCPPDDPNCVPIPPIYYFRGITTSGEFGPMSMNGSVFHPASPGSTVFEPVLIRRSKRNHFERQSYLNQIYSADTFSSLTLRTPDGVFHELYDVQTQGKPFKGTYDGSFLPTTAGFNRGKVFRSTDGSDITAISTADVHDSVPNNPGTYGFSGTIFLKSGTRFVVNGVVLSAVDRNGNTTSFAHGSSGGGRLTKVTTPNGTTVEFGYGIESYPTTFPETYLNTITYEGTAGQTRQVKAHYGLLHTALRPAMNGYPAATSQTVRQLFVNDVYVVDGTHDPYVLTKVEYPDGRSFDLKYNSYGELSFVMLPTGGSLSYEYGTGFGSGTGTYWIGAWEVNRRIKERRVHDETGDILLLQKFDNQTHSSTLAFKGFAEEESFEPAGGGQFTRIAKTKHYYHGNPIQPTLPYPDKGQYVKWDNGREYKTEHYAGDGTTLLRTSEQIWQQKNNSTFSWWRLNSGIEEPPNDPRVVSTRTTLVDTNQVAMTSFKYDDFMNVTDTFQYDYGQGSPGNLLSVSHSEFETSAAYTSTTGAYLRGLPKETWIGGPPHQPGQPTVPVEPPEPNPTPSGTPLPTPVQIHVYSRARYDYDNYSEDPLMPRTDVFGHDITNYGATSPVKRGNVTRITTYSDVDNEIGTAILLKKGYDILGNLIKTVDPEGNVSTFGYEDNFGAADGEATANTPPIQLNGLSSFAFATKSTNPLTWNAYVQYDYFTGSPVNTQDPTGIISKTIYGDLLDRPTQFVDAVGTPLQKQTTIAYQDGDRTIQMTSDLKVFDDNLLKSTTLSDGLGRTVETRNYEPNGDYRAVRTIFDSLGRPHKTSNPFRANEVNANNPILWTQSFFDPLGRLEKVRTPDNAETVTSYTGNAITMTDQSGTQRRSITNVVGNLIRVDEATSNGLGAIGSPNQPTLYSYDVLNNLISIVQNGSQTEQCGPNVGSCSQTRTFSYDSLSRLLSTNNPESGQVNYVYDANGNLTQKDDERGVRTTYAYDALNRTTMRNYSTPGGPPANFQISPNVGYTYDDPSIANSRGKLTRVTSAISTTDYASFDILGRVTRSKQTTNDIVYGDDTNPMTYSYNLAGALIEQTYPSGRVVRNVLETNGELSLVQSNKTPIHGFHTYASSFSYSAAGAITSMQLGNGHWESTKFNSRLQPTQIALGTVQNGTDKLDIDFTYGVVEGGILNPAKNNGNIQSQSIAFSGLNHSFEQSYTYDPVKRLASATEKSNGSVIWKQTLLYDRYGNRRFEFAGGGTTVPASDCITAICNPAISATSNQITSPGYDFDSSGNTTYDASLRRFTYDAENKQVKAESTNVNQQVTGVLSEYFHDGEGKRVKKVVGSEVTIFVYDATGKQVSEYSTATASGNNAKVAYLTTDHLGSPRINTDQYATISARHDYHPYGEQITAGRAEIGQYTTDSIRRQFTGYERDSEDFDFAETRMYANKLGRFAAVDKVKIAKERLSDPQRINLYVYARNNPFSYVDPDGMDIKVTTKDGKELFVLNDGKKAITVMTAKQLYDKGIQWFEPEADNYMPLKSMARGIETFPELKHFSWQEIADFADVSRIDTSFRSGGSGDWKNAVAKGYFLVTVGGKPYWADAIGQIPFAVDMFKDYLTDTSGNKYEAVKKTLETGQEWATGTVGGSADRSNSYDNHFILRGAIWASYRYDAQQQKGWFYDSYVLKKVEGSSHAPDYLADTVSNATARQYGLK